MMKKSGILIMITLFFTTAHAQMTLEHTYDYSVSTAYIDGEGYKFYEMDIDNNQCVIYNLDHTHYQTIDLDVPEGQYLYDLKYVTNHLFDDDDEIEVCYTYYEYFSSEEYTEYTTKVINAGGSEIVSIPGASYVTLMTVSEEGDYNFVAYVYDYSVSTAVQETKVYSLSNQPTNVILHSGQVAGSKAYPNPAKDKVTISYEINSNVRDGVIKVFTTSGKKVAEMPLPASEQKITLNTSSINSGTYIYRIEADGSQAASGKFVVNH